MAGVVIRRPISAAEYDRKKWRGSESKVSARHSSCSAYSVVVPGHFRVSSIQSAIPSGAGVLPGPVAMADATHLPMATASCDAALALHMLHHVTDLAQTVGELSRVVKQGGLV
ncbi:hypothetical protein D3C57_126055 [Streptomyces rapamycinicus NRRL 5491]|uniref:Methyltransferase type 11 domain-containing protein n=2 Tax=Streptomyces rapamycinicus TaxID=1226757 RepID=A0A3L8RQC3_STRRN|nr:hypothetical protein D3C57_126055 [Streptomyces rapamycinicus NRRL 5491]